MKHVSIIGRVCIIMMLFAAYVSAQTATPTALIVNYDQTLVPQDLKPGDIKPMYIVIQNTGGLTAREVRVTIPSQKDLFAEGPSSNSLAAGGTWALGTVNPGQSARVVTSLRARPDAKIGTHYLTVYLKYDESRYDSSESITIEEETTKWIIPVEIRSGSLFELGGFTVNSEELKAGETYIISLDLKNTGEADAHELKSYLGMPKDGTPTNMQINVQLAQAFTVLGNVDNILGDVPQGEIGKANLMIHIDENIPAKAYTLPITAEYEDDSGTVHTDIFYVGVVVSGERKLAITNFQTDPVELHADEDDIEITGNIENQGTEQVKNIKVTFVPGNPLENARSYVQKKEVGTLSGGKSLGFTFYADIPEEAKAQTSEVTFELEYEVNSKKFKDMIIQQLDIQDHPRFEIIQDESSTQPEDQGSTRMTLTNKGSKCEGVTVIVLEKRDQPFDFDDKSAYVGDLDTEDDGVATIQYTVEEDATPQPHLVPIEIRCTKDDEVLVFSKSMKLTVAKAGEKRDYKTLFIAGLVVLSIGCFIVYKIGHSHGHKKVCDKH